MVIEWLVVGHVNGIRVFAGGGGGGGEDVDKMMVVVVDGIMGCACMRRLIIKK